MWKEEERIGSAVVILNNIPAHILTSGPMFTQPPTTRSTSLNDLHGERMPGVEKHPNSPVGLA